MITSGDGVPAVYKRPQRQRRTMVRHQCSQGRISHHWWDHHCRYYHHRCIMVHIMYTGISPIFTTDHKDSTCKTRRVGRLRLWKHWVQNSTTNSTSKTSGLTTWNKCRDITRSRHNRWSGASRGCSSIRRQSTRCSSGGRFTSTTSTGIKALLTGQPLKRRRQNLKYKLQAVLNNQHDCQQDSEKTLAVMLEATRRPQNGFAPRPPPKLPPPKPPRCWQSFPI